MRTGTASRRHRAALAWLLLTACVLPPAWGEAVEPKAPVEVQVLRVLDGDTFDVVGDGGRTQRVRLIGVGAPELGNVVPCARRHALAAKATLEALLTGGVVRLEFDRVLHDDYRRWLAYAHVGEVFVNSTLITRGLAVAADSGKNRRHKPFLAQRQADAVAAGLGIWGP